MRRGWYKLSGTEQRAAHVGGLMLCTSEQRTFLRHVMKFLIEISKLIKLYLLVAGPLGPGGPDNYPLAISGETRGNKIARRSPRNNITKSVSLFLLRLEDVVCSVVDRPRQ